MFQNAQAIDWYRAGKGDDAWRNHQDGTTFSVGSIECKWQQADELLALMATAGSYESQYCHAHVEHYSYCDVCGGIGTVSKRTITGRPGISKRCPECKGKISRSTSATFDVWYVGNLIAQPELIAV